MKKLSYIIFIIFLLVIAVPTIILQFYNNSNEGTPTPKITDNKKIKLYIKERDLVVDLPIEEYIKGVVAAEMPAEFENEALKAQAIATRTFTYNKILHSNEDEKKAHKGADICSDYAHCQAWKDKGELKKSWGFFGYYRYWNKISKAVDDTKDMIIVYNGELIDPLFHSTSGGKTENSEDVFSTSLPYLRSVISQGEEASPKFKDKVVMSFNEFKNKIESISKGLNIQKKDIQNIKIIERSEGGKIKKVQIGNKIFDGTQIRNALSLDSANFEINFNGNNIIINTIGYGHGVGMSQFGANYLAKTGKTYEDILKHYYTGVNINKINDLKK